MNCFRCGYCCSSLAVIPKTKDSDISPDKLASLSIEESIKYTEEHCHFTGADNQPCGWLEQVSETSYVCSVYEHRGSCCRDYCADQQCKIGLHRQLRYMQEGIALPDDIVAALNEYLETRKEE